MTTIDISGIAVCPSDKIRPEDYDNAHQIEFDQAGVYKHFKELQTELHELVMEVIQNAIDSTEPGEPNIIEILRGRYPAANPDTEPILTVTDHGKGIARDYDDDIYKFIHALKAKSFKVLREHSLGSKGIGMLQFTNIGERVLITSMYKGIIVRFLMSENENERLEFSGLKIVLQPTEKDKEFYGMNHEGTRVSFYHRPAGLAWIQRKGLIKLIELIQEEYAMRMIDNPRLKIILDKKNLPPPKWIREHPPYTLYINKKGHEVRGAIWGDPRGAGAIKMYRGHKIQVRSIALRQCQGYFENWDLSLSAPRTSFIENTEWFDCIHQIRSIMEKFPPIGQDTDDPKQSKRDIDMAKKVLDLPKVPTAHGAENDLTKEDGTGDPKGTDKTGYLVSEKTGKKGGKKKPHTRDNKNQTKIGDEGTDTVKKGSSRDKDKRKDYQDLEETKGHYGKERPFFLLFKDRLPWLLSKNLDNEEYPVWRKMTKTDPRAYVQMFYVWLGEADQLPANEDPDESWRMILSRKRVEYWNKLGYYPKIAPRPVAVAPVQIISEDGENDHEN